MADDSTTARAKLNQFEARFTSIPGFAEDNDTRIDFVLASNEREVLHIIRCFLASEGLCRVWGCRELQSKKVRAECGYYYHIRCLQIWNDWNDIGPGDTHCYQCLYDLTELLDAHKATATTSTSDAVSQGTTDDETSSVTESDEGSDEPAQHDHSALLEEGQPCNTDEDSDTNGDQGAR